MKTPEDIKTLDDEALGRTVEALLEALDQVVLGQRAAAEEILVAYMAGGHALLEGVPGIGKTLLARAVAAVLGLGMRRIQFTPDLMPSDITGINVYDGPADGFRLIPGPVFTQLLMADEINRTPPKTQSALLEAMQEGQVTIDGESHTLSPLFFVMATQNPIEFEGTYPLPEAQADRFLLKVHMGLPAREHELELLRQGLEKSIGRWRSLELPAAVVTPEQAAALRRASLRTHVSDPLLHYVQELAARLRSAPTVELGPSPRACLALVEAARAAAWLERRDFVTPDDIKRLLTACWGHRLLLAAEAELEGETQAAVLERVVESVPVPRNESGEASGFDPPGLEAS